MGLGVERVRHSGAFRRASIVCCGHGGIGGAWPSGKELLWCAMVLTPDARHMQAGTALQHQFDSSHVMPDATPVQPSTHGLLSIASAFNCWVGVGLLLL